MRFEKENREILPLKYSNQYFIDLCFSLDQLKVFEGKIGA